jgi:hypothetical protein
VVTGPSGERLEVHHRVGDPGWPDLAAAYWGGRLPGLERVRSSRFAVVERGRPAGGGPAVFFKRFLLRGWPDRVKHWVRASRARRALRAGETVGALGFGVPPALCLIEERGAGGVRESALVTGAIEDVRSMYEWVMQPRPDLGDTPARRGRLLRALGREVGAWHRAGLYHGDMQPRNILGRERDGRFEFFWLDNEGVRRFATLPPRMRVRNLVQITRRLRGIPRTDYARFARGYFETAGLSCGEARAVERRVARALVEAAAPAAAAARAR